MYLTDRVVDLEEGSVMVATDIHGNWKDYSRLLARFDAREADTLVIMGDVVHPESQVKDRSRRILDDLIARGANTPDARIIVLMGNHDMVHPYHMDLSLFPLRPDQKVGKHVGMASLERRLADDREHYMAFFRSMPFAVRTGGGVLLIHVGANSILGTGQEDAYGISFDEFSHWSHVDLLQKMVLIAKKNGKRSDTEVFNPTLGKYITKTKRGKFLYEFLFSRNEREFGSEYATYIPGFLKFMSTGKTTPLTSMITGHVKVPEGVRVVCDEQLRISTSAGVLEKNNKSIVLLETDTSYENAQELAGLVRNLYD